MGRARETEASRPGQPLSACLPIPVTQGNRAEIGLCFISPGLAACPSQTRLPPARLARRRTRQGQRDQAWDSGCLAPLGAPGLAKLARLARRRRRRRRRTRQGQGDQAWDSGWLAGWLPAPLGLDCPSYSRHVVGPGLGL